MTTDPPERRLGPVGERSPAAPEAKNAPEHGTERNRGGFAWRSPGTWLPKALTRSPATAGPSDRPAAGILDEREHRFSVAATVLALGLVATAYVVNRHSTTLKVRSDATTLLIAGLILIAIMFGGVFFRRASMVGIASFMMGFELFSGGDIFGVLFLVFGGWLLVRMVRRQRAEQLAGGKPARVSKTTAVRSSGRPKPSKRYTPPRRSRASSRRR